MNIKSVSVLHDIAGTVMDTGADWRKYDGGCYQYLLLNLFRCSRTLVLMGLWSAIGACYCGRELLSLMVFGSS